MIPCLYISQSEATETIMPSACDSKIGYQIRKIWRFF